MIVSLLVSLEIIPWIWINVDRAIWKYMNVHFRVRYELKFRQQLHCPMFYIACSFLWTALMLPSTYWENCIQGTTPKFEKKTVREWINMIMKEQIIAFVKVWMIIWMTEGDLMRRGVDAVYREMFSISCLMWLLWMVYVTFLRPFLPARLFRFDPLKAEDTKFDLDRLAKDLKFPLGSIYTSKGSQAQAGTLVFGPPWSRKIAIPDSVLEICSTEDVVALVACEIGSWMNNLALQAISTVIVSLKPI